MKALEENTNISNLHEGFKKVERVNQAMLCLSMSHTESTEGNKGTEGWVVGIFMYYFKWYVYFKWYEKKIDDVG